MGVIFEEAASESAAAYNFKSEESVEADASPDFAEQGLRRRGEIGTVDRYPTIYSAIYSFVRRRLRRGASLRRGRNVAGFV